MANVSKSFKDILEIIYWSSREDSSPNSSPEKEDNYKTALTK